MTNGGKHAVYNTFQVLCDPGNSTSSPGSHSTWNVLYTACLPPFVTTTCAAVHSTPESRLVLCAIASRSSGRPAVGE